MNLLNKLTIKNLKLNKKRTIVTIIGIMLSVALITAVASMYSSGIKSLINFETYQQGDFHVAYYDVPIDDLNVFKNNRSIEKTYLTKNIGYAEINSKNEFKPYAYIKAFTKESLNNLSVKLVKGRFPENENEILIPTHLQTNGRLVLNIGDTITLNVGKRVNNEGYELDQSNPFNHEDHIEGTTAKNYKIVGIIERPATNVEGYSAPGYTFITYINEENLNNTIDVYTKYTKEGTKNSYKITANIIGVDENLFEKIYTSNDGLSKEELIEYENQMDNAKYQININGYLIALETNPITNSGIGGLGFVVIIVMGIIVFTSVFCIKNSFDISITEKIKQYGMLRSIGATKRQIKKNVFYEASILGLIGIPLGLLSGLIASYILVIISNYYLSSAMTNGLKLEFSFSFVALLVAVTLGIVTIYFSAFKSAKRASKVSPIDSIRNSANIKINSKKIKSSKLIKNIFGIGGEISYKNLKRNKRKYRTTVLSIVVSVFVFIALSSFMNIAFGTVDSELKISDYNLSLSIQDFNDETYNKFVETTKLDNIENYTILRTGDISIDNKYYNKQYIDFLDIELDQDQKAYLTIASLGEEQFNKYAKQLGFTYEDIKDKGILLDYGEILKFDEKTGKTINKYMRRYNLDVGDKVNFTPTNNEQLFEIEIGAITREKPFGLKNNNNIMLIVSDSYYDKVTDTKMAILYFKSNNANKLQDDIDDYLKDEDYNLNNVDENARIMNNLFTLVGIFLYGFIIVISLIGITNIFNTITTNMELRKQEFAMLKSVGMTTKEFNKMIRLESLFMGIKALLFGIPIGIALSYIIYYLLSPNTGLSYEFPILAILIAVSVVFILISLIMKYSISKINKQNTIETIRNENI